MPVVNTTMKPPCLSLHWQTLKRRALFGWLVVWLILLASSPFAQAAESTLDRKTRELDEQTQALKREVLELGRNLAYLAWVGGVRPAGEPAAAGNNARYNLKALSDDTLRMGHALTRLEDGVLAPPGIQLVVFTSIESGDKITVKEITLKVDDKIVMRRKYQDAEISALRQGGAHRLYTGNLPEGPHRLTAHVIIESEKRKLQNESLSMDFIKGGDRKTLELRIANSFGSARIKSLDWNQ